MTIKRREMLKMLGGALAVVPFVGLTAGCPLDDDDDSAGDDDDAVSCTGDATGSSNTHGHTITVTQADLEDAITNGTDLVVDAEGGGHAHTVTFTLGELEELRDSCQVTVDATSGHPHTWDVQKS